MSILCEDCGAPDARLIYSIPARLCSGCAAKREEVKLAQAEGRRRSAESSIRKTLPMPGLQPDNDPVDNDAVPPEEPVGDGGDRPQRRTIPNTDPPTSDQILSPTTIMVPMVLIENEIGDHYWHPETMDLSAAYRFVESMNCRNPFTAKVILVPVIMPLGADVPDLFSDIECEPLRAVLTEQIFERALETTLTFESEGRSNEPIGEQEHCDPIASIGPDGISYRFPKGRRASQAELIGVRPGVQGVGELLEVSSLQTLRDRFADGLNNLVEFDPLIVVRPGEIRPVDAISSSETYWEATNTDTGAWVDAWCESFDNESKGNRPPEVSLRTMAATGEPQK